MKILSLFSGIGGFDLAFRNKGHTIIGACEIDKYARSVYSRHFPGVTIYQDATKINPEKLEDFDCLCAGFPCQAFSIAGKRLGFEESRGTLFFEIARIARQKRPRLLLLENVKGLLSHDRGRTFAVILAALDELGYDAEWQVLNSKYFVPQNRERIYIIGYLRGEPRPEIFPIGENIKGNNSSRHKTQKDGSRVRDQITGSIQTSPTKGVATMIVGAIDANYHKGGGTRTMIGWSKSTRDWGVEQRFKIGEANTLNTGEGCRNQSTGNYVIQESSAIPVLLANLNSNGRRMKTHEEDTFTLDASASQGLFDGKKVRRLTPLECERLQGFPDNYTEGLSDNQRYKCLGNAVTVPVVEYIVERLDSKIFVESTEKI